MSTLGRLDRPVATLGGGDGEYLPILAGGRLVGRGEQFPALRAENGQQIVHLPRFGGFDQRTYGVFRRGERSRGGALSRDDK
jgi:hypothetical protein